MLAAEAEHLFPKAYGQVLGALLDELAEKMLLSELEEFLRDFLFKASQPNLLTASSQVLAELLVLSTGKLKQVSAPLPGK